MVDFGNGTWGQIGDGLASFLLPSASLADGALLVAVRNILKSFGMDPANAAVVGILGLVAALGFLVWFVWNAGTSDRQHPFDFRMLARRSLMPLAWVGIFVGIWGVLVLTR